MKKFFSLFLILTTFIVFIGAKPVKDDSINRIIISQDEIIDGPLFKAGESILLNGEVNGDVILIAGEVIVNATISGDLIIFAGQADIKGDVADDLRVIAGQVDINAKIKGDASIAAGQTTINQDSEISNHLILFSALADHSGLVNKNVWIYAARTRFNGQSNENVFLSASNVDIYSDTNINGNLKITYGEKPIISNRAQIGGDLIEEKSLSLDNQRSLKDLQIKKPAVKGISAFIAIQNLIALSINVLIGWLILALIPDFAKKLINIGQTQSGSAIGWGLLTLLIVPVIGLTFIISLIGIPFGVLTFMYYAISIYFAHLVSGLIIGSRLLKDKKFKKPYKSFLLGMLILAVLKLIPVLGWLVYFILTLFGLGTLTLYEKTVLAKLKKKK